MNIEYDIEPTEPIIHDSRGLIKNDIKHLRSIFKQRRYKPTISKDDIMYLEGQLSVLDYIENKMISRGGM